jgi:hypothetical protein
MFLHDLAVQMHLQNEIVKGIDVNLRIMRDGGRFQTVAHRFKKNIN